MRRLLFAAALLLALALTGQAQGPEPLPTPPVPALHEVPGLKLTPPVKAPAGRLVRVVADCAGPVSFLPIASADFAVEAEIEAAAKRILVVMPPDEGQAVLIVAVGVVDGKPTAFAQTLLVSEGPTSPGEDNPGKKPRPPPKPGPGPTPKPLPLPAGKLHVTLVLDYATLPPAAATLANSPTLRKAMADAGHSLHVLAATAPEVLARQLGRFVQQAGGSPAVIMQDAQGKVLRAARMPATEAELLGLVLGR